MSDEGKGRQQAQADAITTEISKYLAFCSRRTLRWNYLWDIREVRRYMEHLTQQGIGVDGRLTKLDRIGTALCYFKLELVDEDDYVLDGRLGRALDRLKVMEATLRPKKVQKRVAQMEALSSMPLSLDEVTAVVDNPEMWAYYDCTVNNCKRDKPVSSSDLAISTAALLALLTFKNWQRAGAAAHLTLQEYHQASRVQVGGTDLLVLKVKHHKTGVKEGSAKLTLAPEDAKRLDRYYRHIRPLLDPAVTHQEFLLLPGGKPVKTSVSDNEKTRKVWQTRTFGDLCP